MSSNNPSNYQGTTKPQDAQYPPSNTQPRVVFPVVKNPHSSNKPIPYSQDPYQEPFDEML